VTVIAHSKHGTDCKNSVCSDDDDDHDHDDDADMSGQDDDDDDDEGGDTIVNSDCSPASVNRCGIYTYIHTYLCMYVRTYIIV